MAGIQAFVFCNLSLLNSYFPHSDEGFSPKFNARDGEVERKSLNGLYVVENGRPRWVWGFCLYVHFSGVVSVLLQVHQFQYMVPTGTKPREKNGI